MKQMYRGYEIWSERQKALGGWDEIYWYACRKPDGYMIRDGFGDYGTVREAISSLKKSVDSMLDEYGNDTERWEKRFDTV